MNMTQVKNENALATFALDPNMTRTGQDFRTSKRLGDDIIHNSPAGKHSFLHTPMIDDDPNPKAGKGIHSFRDRDKSKEI